MNRPVPRPRVLRATVGWSNRRTGTEIYQDMLDGSSGRWAKRSREEIEDSGALLAHELSGDEGAQLVVIVFDRWGLEDADQLAAVVAATLDPKGFAQRRRDLEVRYRALLVAATAVAKSLATHRRRVVNGMVMDPVLRLKVGKAPWWKPTPGARAQLAAWERTLAAGIDPEVYTPPADAPFEKVSDDE